MYHHYDAIKNGNNLKNSKLENKLKKLITENLKPIYRKVLETAIEQEAFDKEIELIKFYGKENLCNIMDGGQGGLPHFKNKEEEKLWHSKGGIAANKKRTKKLVYKLNNDKKFKEKWKKIFLKD